MLIDFLNNVRRVVADLQVGAFAGCRTLVVFKGAGLRLEIVLT